MSRAARLGYALLTLVIACLAGLTLASPAAALTSAPSSVRSAPDILGCTVAPTPEMPGRGMVGFFESQPSQLPAAGNPFAAGEKTTTIYEQYGYAGLRWNTYDLGCGPDLARSPDASVGTAVANWMFNLPKTAVAATGAVVGQAFSPDFLGFFDPLISTVVDGLQHAVFEQWFSLVVAAMGLLLIWKARQASLASSASAIGWALLVMVLVSMVFRWPLVAGHAADTTVTSTLSTVNAGLNGGQSTADGNPGSTAVAGMQEALLYRSWLGGTFGDADSQVARSYGPQLFDAQALTWREANIVQTDPQQGDKIIEAKKAKFVDIAAKVQAQDPDAYEYLTGRRSDSRVGYALLASIAALCAVPFLLMAGLLVLGALVIVRFGVMLFPAFATLGLFPSMRGLVTTIGSTVAAALINAIIFGIGASVTILGMGVLLGPGVGAAWLQIVLMLLLTIVMWVALSPFRRLTQMVSHRNPLAGATAGISAGSRGAARSGSRILTGALGSFIGNVAAARVSDHEDQRRPQLAGVPQRSEATAVYYPIVITDYGSPPRAAPASLSAGAAADGQDADVAGTVAEGQPAGLSVGAPRAPRAGLRPGSGPASGPGPGSGPVAVVRGRDDDLGPDDIYTPGPRTRAESLAPSARTAPVRGGEIGSGRFESGADPDDVAFPVARAQKQRPVPAERREATTMREQWREELENQSDGGIDELAEVFRPPAPSPERSRG